jgi:hypothetical protein
MGVELVGVVCLGAKIEAKGKTKIGPGKEIKRRLFVTARLPFTSNSLLV